MAQMWEGESVPGADVTGVSPVPSARSDRIRIRTGRHEARSSADCRWPFCSQSLTGRCRRGQPRLRQVRREFRRSCALTALGGRVTHLRHGSTSDQQVELVLLPEELVGEPLPHLRGANSRHVAYNAQPTPGATQSGTPYRNAVPWPSAGVTWPELVGMIASATFLRALGSAGERSLAQNVAKDLAGSSSFPQPHDIATCAGTQRSRHRIAR